MSNTSDRNKSARSSVVSSPLLEGFLLKKGAKGLSLGWKRRWFTLSGDRLYYFKTSDASQGTELGYIDLSGEYEIEFSPDADNFNFRIRTLQRIWHLTAEAEEERRFWVEGLSAFKKRQMRQKTKSPLEPSLSFKRDSPVNYSEEEFSELQELLFDAEQEIDAKQSHIDELNNDLQNSIRIIRLKGEQIDLLTERIQKKEKENKQLLKDNLLLREQLLSRDQSKLSSDPSERETLLSNQVEELNMLLEAKNQALQKAHMEKEILSQLYSAMRMHLGDGSSVVSSTPAPPQNPNSREAIKAWLNWIEKQRLTVLSSLSFSNSESF